MIVNIPGDHDAFRDWCMNEPLQVADVVWGLQAAVIHLKAENKQLKATYPAGEIIRLIQVVADRDAELDQLDLEVHQLRTLNARLERDFADMNNVRSPVFCDATHPDTECVGWIWCCSLIAGHLGPHHCAGAAWEDGAS